ncbi:copper resistance protein CopC [Promicromonospora citrea]|uniref:CopC domain-containing protein n=1 Tax=Promicromonospora citrea TaxID=43677 RepID=A0A8H9GM41_9MICO|nr:copper resistance CopC family protein [Promicromonospora citrea]NNH54312.1 copper resistance protein CopC [Promicromonospora citrea]GGM38239.1 hypothetical protein GCM10010102_37260 [Promicromonospora citrea]
MPRTRPLVAGLTGAVVVLLTTAVPASAHDKLVSSDPAPGQVLDQAPVTVSLTYSADILDMGAAVVVSGDDGTDWVSTAPVIDGPTVTAELDAGLPAAAYEIRWRVVSEDGHPITGVVPFTVGDGDSDGGGNGDDGTDGGGAVTVAPSSAAGVVGPAPQERAQERSQVAQEGEAPWRVVLVGVGGAAVAVALLALVQFLRRRTTADGADA